MSGPEIEPGRGAQAGIETVLAAFAAQRAQARLRGDTATFTEMWCERDGNATLRALGVTDANLDEVMARLLNQMSSSIICC